MLCASMCMLFRSYRLCILYDFSSVIPVNFLPRSLLLLSYSSRWRFVCLFIFFFSSWDALSGISKQRQIFGVKLLLARVGVVISNGCENSIRSTIIHNDEDVSIWQQFAWDTNTHTSPLIEMSDLSFCIQEKVVDFIPWQCQNTSTTDL